MIRSVGLRSKAGRTVRRAHGAAVRRPAGPYVTERITATRLVHSGGRTPATDERPRLCSGPDEETTIAATSDPPGQTRDPAAGMELFDLRVTVDHIEGRSVCGMRVGDYFELVNSSQLRVPADRHFCVYALQSVLPLLPAKQRQLPAGDWLEQDSLVCCPDPEERLVMRIERIGRRRMNAEDLT